MRQQETKTLRCLWFCLQEQGSRLLRLWGKFLNCGRHSGTIFKQNYLSCLPVCHGFPWSKGCRVRICNSSLVAHAGLWFMSTNPSFCIEPGSGQLLQLELGCTFCLLTHEMVFEASSAWDLMAQTSRTSLLKPSGKGIRVS